MALFGVVVACTTSTADGPPPTDDGGSPEQDSSVDDSSTRDGATDVIVDGGPKKPAECDEVTLTTVLETLQKADPESYAFQPYLTAVPKVAGSTGDPQTPNKFFFYLDSANAVGTYPIEPLPTYFYGVSNTGGISTDFVQPDAAPDGGAAGFTHRYIAVSGTITMTSVLTPHQTEGVISNVRFAAIKRNADGTPSLIPGGKCYWLKEAKWNSKRTDGCAPFAANTCGAGKFCMPTNAIGDDGLCVTTGTKQVGEECAQVTDGEWSSDCASGLRCAKFSQDVGETKFTCHKLCDVRSAAPDCASDQHCGGGYNTCMSIAFLQNSPGNGNEIDTVATVGQTCAQNPTAHYCGVSSKPGLCYKDTGAPSSTCRPLLHALSECPAGTSGGYVQYKGGIDQSTVWCFK